MKNKRLILVMAMVAVFAGSTQAQDDWLTKALTKAAGDTGAEQKAKLDSIDFQFAMSVNDNSSFFDIEQKGEGLARAFYTMKPYAEKTLHEIARDTLEFALGFYKIRAFKLAEESLIIARDFMEQNGLTNDISYIRCISNLALNALMNGNILEADQFITYALDESRNTLTETSVAYAANLNSRAKLSQAVGKYNEAEKEFDDALVLVKKFFGESSMQYAIVLNNKAMLYQTMGRYNEAIPLLKDANALAEAALKKNLKGKKSFENRKFLSNLAVVQFMAGNYPEAEKIFLEIKAIFENRGQKNNAEYANLLNQLGLFYIAISKFDQVEALLKKSAEVYKKANGEESPSFAKVQNDLGNFYRMMQRFAEAEPLLKKSVDIRLRLLGDTHPDYIKSVENLAILYWKKGDLAQADPLFSKAMTQSLDFVNRYFPPMSEAEKTRYWDVLSPRFQRYYNYAIEASATNPAVLQAMFNYQIATKALLLNSTNKIKKTILASKDNQLIRDYLDWVTQKEALARYYSLSKEELRKQSIDLPALERAANNLERSLSQRSTDFSQAFTANTVTYKELVAQLTDTEALVEIIRVRTFDRDFTTDSRYVALVLTKGSEPKLALMENGLQLDTRNAKFYKNMIQQKSDDEVSYDQYWVKIDALLTGKKILFVAPDGVYNQLNVNTLKKPGGDYVLNRYDVVVMGNPKDILSLKQRKTVATRKDAFLLGFPDYGGNAVPLPGTKVELETINKILKAGGYQPSLSLQLEATEKKLKTVKAPTLMHIATHGYFLADAEVRDGSAMGIDAENAKNNPLLRSGLLMANPPAEGQQNSNVDLSSNDNGVLTAYEAMNLDLEGTDLIVLSACETALGDVKAGEGVYGLQRAFLVAGANALIMSLWQVDDAATQLLMTNFYTNWTKTGNKAKAFKQAQLQLMTKYKEPYYWGAFVMMGM
ncbi:MAG: CHAT domain-containing protein [Cyclobacteriaceae bacterium]